MGGADVSRPLYELAPTYAALLDANDGEIDAQLVELSEAIEQKATNIAFVLSEMKAESAAVSVELQRLEQRRTAIDARHDKLRDYLQRCMESAGITRVKHALFTISLQENPPRVDVLDETQVPPQYVRTKTSESVDKRAILDDYKRTGEVPQGCETTRGLSLRIR